MLIPFVGVFVAVEGDGLLCSVAHENVGQNLLLLGRDGERVLPPAVELGGVVFTDNFKFGGVGSAYRHGRQYVHKTVSDGDDFDFLELRALVGADGSVGVAVDAEDAVGLGVGVGQRFGTQTGGGQGAALYLAKDEGGGRRGEFLF